MPNTPAPLNLSLTLWQGQTFDEQLLLQDDSSPPNPIDLTGFTAQMMLRNDIADAKPVVTWGTASGEIALGDATGLLTFNVTGAATQALPTGNDVVVFVYDILITNAASPPYSQRIAEGQLTVFPAVTRPTP